MKKIILRQFSPLSINNTHVCVSKIVCAWMNVAMLHHHIKGAFCIFQTGHVAILHNTPAVPGRPCSGYQVRSCQNLPSFSSNLWAWAAPPPQVLPVQVRRAARLWGALQPQQVGPTWSCDHMIIWSDELSLQKQHNSHKPSQCVLQWVW